MVPNPNIKHIIVLMMENRSFDHMLGFMMSENAAIGGVVAGNYPNKDNAGTAHPVTNGAAYQGQLIEDPGHDYVDAYLQMYGVSVGEAAPADPTMLGFALSYEQQGGNPADIMRCFEPAQVPVLATLARQYAVCDQWFASLPGPTLPNRAFAHFGTSFGRLDMSPVYFKEATSIYQRMNQAGKTAKIYYYSTSSGTMGMTFLLSEQKQYFGLWGDFKSDCSNGSLPDYSFVEPNYQDDGGVLATDQHPDNNVQAGDNFIKAVYTAIRSNDDTWKSTVLLIVWDEGGGIFDHVPPPPVAPDGFPPVATTFKFDRLGIRVPAVVVSPYVERGQVVHTVFEHASIPATVAEQFLPPPAGLAGAAPAPPFPREQHANTFLSVLTRADPRMDVPVFPAPAAASLTPMAFAAGATSSSAAGKPSQLLQDHVQEIHEALLSTHPREAHNLDGSKAKQSREAALQFVKRAMALIHPEAANRERSTSDNAGAQR